MVACFLLGELTSDRLGPALRQALAAAGLTEQVLVHADLTDDDENHVRTRLLGVTRGYGQDRELFDGGFPTEVTWVWAEPDPTELAAVRYVDYSYWNELSGGSRLPADAAVRIRAGERAFGVSNGRFLDTAQPSPVVRTSRR
jgi:hypothetical protein